MNWRLIDSYLADGATNMAVDEAILHAHAEGAVPPTVRFYGWKEPTLSIGYFQKILREINLAECSVRGIDIVRRLTGGRAVLHDQELTYSIIVNENHPLIPKTVTASYRFLSEGLLQALHAMGISARMNMPRAAYGQVRHAHSSAACFDAVSHYEITVAGRKIIGSAQLRKDGILLQHGSILLDFYPEIITAIMQPIPGTTISSLTEMMAARVTSLTEQAGRSVTWQEAYSVFVEKLGPALGINLLAGELSSQEREMSDFLARTKYSTEEWTYRR